MVVGGCSCGLTTHPRLNGVLSVNGYAYYYYYYSLGAFWHLLVKTPAAFRLLMGSGEGSGVTRWLEYSHPRFVRIVEGWEAKSPADLSAKELLAGARELLDAGTEYYTSVQPALHQNSL